MSYIGKGFNLLLNERHYSGHQRQANKKQNSHEDHVVVLAGDYLKHRFLAMRKITSLCTSPNPMVVKEMSVKYMEVP